MKRLARALRRQWERFDTTLHEEKTARLEGGKIVWETSHTSRRQRRHRRLQYIRRVLRRA